MQNVTITIKLPEVYYQVALQAHLLGEADLSQDKDARAVSLSQLDVEGESREVILRAVKASDASLRQRLHLYLTEENTATSVDNVPKDEEALTFSLRLPRQLLPPSSQGYRGVYPPLPGPHVPVRVVCTDEGRNGKCIQQVRTS